MLSKSEKLWIKSLMDKKTRHYRSEFTAEGSRIILDLIKTAPEKLLLLCATQEWYAAFKQNLPPEFDKIRFVSNSELQSVSTLKSTEEVLGIFTFPEYPMDVKNENNLIIYLDKIRNPGNLGAIIRSADWFGIQQLFCSPDCVDLFNNKCVQATMSSIFRVQIILKTWDEMLENYREVDKYAASSLGKSLYHFNKETLNFICIGNEANGLSPIIIKDCISSVSIPSDHSLGAESLNAAVACSLIMAWKKFG